MNVKPLIGLAGVVLGVAFSELNDQVVGAALPDIVGGLGFGQDVGTWLRTVYLVGLVLGAVTGPSLAVGVSQRRFLMGAVALVCGASLLFPVSNAVPLLFISRTLQGIGQGFIISNLISVSLKVLPPSIRLYGLVFYALTATCIPSLATSLAALWTDVVDDWRLIFVQSLPMALLSGVLVWWGLPDEPPKPETFKSYDWPGALLALLGFGALTAMMEEGEQYDWFNSPLISILALVGAVGVPLFVARELTAKSPLIGFFLLKRRNLAYPASALVIFLIITVATAQAPLTFLQAVQGYRPLQSQTVSLVIALSQFALLAFDGAAARFRVGGRADRQRRGARCCILASCGWGVLVSSVWNREQFVPLQLLQAVGLPMVIMPLLMMATNALTPEEGPLGSSLVNATRGLAEALGAGLLAVVTRVGGATHRFQILDTVGANRIAPVAAGPPSRRRAAARSGRAGTGLHGSARAGRGAAPADRRAGDHRHLCGDRGRGRPPSDRAGDRARAHPAAAAGAGGKGLTWRTRSRSPRIRAPPPAARRTRPRPRSRRATTRAAAKRRSRSGRGSSRGSSRSCSWGWCCGSSWPPHPRQKTDDAYVTAHFSTVAPRVAGQVAVLAVTDNQPVKAGQLLLQLDDRDYRAALLQAQAVLQGDEARVEEARAELLRQPAAIRQAEAQVAVADARLQLSSTDAVRYANLAATGAGTVQQRQQAATTRRQNRAELASAEAGRTGQVRQLDALAAAVDAARARVGVDRAQVVQAELNLSYTQVVAPIDGVVDQRQVQVGNYVAPGSPVMVVAPLQSVYVMANYRELALRHMRPGQPVRIHVDAYDVDLRGVVDSLPAASGAAYSPIPPTNATGNFTKIVQRLPVKITFLPGQRLLGLVRVGMSVETVVDTHLEDVVGLQRSGRGGPSPVRAPAP